MTLPILNQTRCTGHCCRRFPLPFVNIAQMKEAMSKTVFQDGDQILDMVIYLGPHTQTPETHGYYTCKHFKDNNCAIYDQRPRMCSEYPYGDKCTVEGCTYSGLGEAD